MDGKEQDEATTTLLGGDKQAMSDLARALAKRRKIVQMKTDADGNTVVIAHEKPSDVKEDRGN